MAVAVHAVAAAVLLWASIPPFAASAAVVADASAAVASTEEQPVCDASDKLNLVQQRAENVLSDRSGRQRQSASRHRREEATLLDGSLSGKNKPVKDVAAEFEYLLEGTPTEDLLQACEDCTVKHNQHLELVQRKCGIIWYYHIPKCSGEAVNWWLFRMKEQLQIDDVHLLHSMDAVINYTQFHKEHLEPVIQDPRGRLVAVHHHDRGPGLYGMEETFDDMRTRLQEQGCDLYRVTFLREPRNLLKSTLVFYDGAEHEEGSEWVAPDPVRWETDLRKRYETALKTDAIYDNMMVRYILNNRLENDGPNPRSAGASYPMKVGELNSSALEAAKNILSSFEYVGFTNNLEEATYKLSHEMGFRDLVMMQKRNVFGVDQANMQPKQLSDDAEDALSSEPVVKLLAKNTAFDEQLYDWAKTWQEESSS